MDRTLLTRLGPVFAAAAGMLLTAGCNSTDPGSVDTVTADPGVVILDGEHDWAHPDDPEVYPYYVQLNDAGQVHHPFSRGDRVPDRTYVVFKALARNPERRQAEGDDFAIALRGRFEGDRHNATGGDFRFQSGLSAAAAPTWGATCDTCWYADTLGFMPGPRTVFTMYLESVDGDGTHDGGPDSLSFNVGYPPCVQCVEVLPKVASVSSPPSQECVDEAGMNPCFADTAAYFVSLQGLQSDELQLVRNSNLAIDKSTYDTQIVDDPTGLEGTNYIIPVTIYNLTVSMHAEDDAAEAWADPEFRAMAWRYQVDYECDPFNQIKDGGGNDDITRSTWGGSADGQRLTVDPGTGVWRMHVDVAVPTVLLAQGSQTYWVTLLYVVANGDSAVAEQLFTLSLRQLGAGTVRAIALDQSQCGALPTGRPALYNYFEGVRPPVASLDPGQTWRDCNPPWPGIQGSLDLSEGAMGSLGGMPVVKPFRIVARTPAGDVADGCSSR